MTIQELLKGANENQSKAIQHIYGPCIVLSGAGSGKSFTLVRRTANMIVNNVSPSEICLFTFTNKAANEIKERVTDYIGDKAKEITMGTYHSVCCRLLRQYASRLGFTKSFSIYDADEAKKVAKKSADKYNVDVKDLIPYISNCKKKMISPQNALSLTEGKPKETDMANAYKDYEDSLKKQNAMDFDNLIIHTVNLLKLFPDVKQSINNRWRFIMADESQDSSVVDMALLKLLAGKEENICMVGDYDQSIYGFRGSDVYEFSKFRYTFDKETTVFNLAENYRSSQTIVEASKSLIANNEMLLKEKKVIAARDFQGAPIIVKKTNTPKAEAYAIASMININLKQGIQYKDIAVLYRTQSISKDIEQVLLEKKIPYEINGGISFMNRKEVKDILSYIRIVINPYDVEAFKRSISIPKRGVGEKTVEKVIETFINNPNMSLLEATKQTELKGKTAKAIKEYLTFIDELEVIKSESTPTDCINHIIDSIQYKQHLLDFSENEEEYEIRLSVLDRLIMLSQTFDSLEDFISSTSLEGNEYEESKNCVKLMTMHASKGLEFPTVIIAGCSEGIAPHFKSLGSIKDMEEERRLFYVALTRAKNTLFITYSDKVYANRTLINAAPSRFIREINKYTKMI